MTKGRLLLSAFLIASALALVACGGGGDDEGDETAIIGVISGAAISTDPADCEALQTVAFMEQSSEEEGQGAVEECEEEAEDPTGDPRSVSIHNVEVDGSNATADAAFVGGTFDGQTVTIALVEEDGSWKLDQIERFATLDREKLIGSFEEALEEGEDLGEEEAACILESLEELSDVELEEIVLNGPEGLVELAEECV